MSISVDFQYKGFNYGIFYGVLRWKPGSAETAQLSAVWPDEWVEERLDLFIKDELNEIVEERRKKAWLKSAVSQTFTRGEIEHCIHEAIKDIRALIEKEAQSLPNLDRVPGRMIKEA